MLVAPRLGQRRECRNGSPLCGWAEDRVVGVSRGAHVGCSQLEVLAAARLGREVDYSARPSVRYAHGCAPASPLRAQPRLEDRNSHKRTCQSNVASVAAARLTADESALVPNETHPNQPALPNLFC